MAKAHVMKSLFVLATLMVNDVVVVAMRIQHTKKDKLQSGTRVDASKTPDLDWKGCAAWTSSGCKSQPGCGHHHVWLDTWRQSCRYTAEFKLQRDNIQKFFPVEIARLDEKTQIFAKHGCITGGWYYKCYRRMQQILRLFNYVRKAKTSVIAEGESHPAYEVVAEAQQRFINIAENLATGFGKNKQTEGFCMSDGIRKMMSIPAEVQKLQEESAAAGVTLTGEEVASIEQSKQAAALLMMSCSKFTDAGIDSLRAKMEAAGQSQVVAGAAKDALDGMVADEEDMLSLLDADGRKKLNEAAKEEYTEDEDDVDEHELSQEGDDTVDAAEQRKGNASMIQLATRAGDGPLKILVVGGWNGMKWLVQNGVQWLFRRLAWTLAFLVGFSFSMVRAFAFWPALYVSCVAVRSQVWFWRDVMWEGENIAKGFNKIGHCAPEMWDFVGFDSHDPHHNAVEQIVIQPAKFASYATGVYDPLLGPPKRPHPCLKVTCGDRAHCSTVYNYNAGKEEGQCFCRDGAYPDPQNPTGCELKTTKNGCRCMQRWTSWGLSYYGCNWNGECKVDRSHNSFHSCRARNNADDIWVSRTSNLVFETDKEYDSCRFETSPQKVRAVRIAP